MSDRAAIAVGSVALTAGLLLASGSSMATLTPVDPDTFSSGTDIRTAFGGVTLSVADQPNVAVIPLLGTSVFLGGKNIATTGQMVFARDPAGDCSVLAQDTARTWEDTPCGMLRALFRAPTNYVQIDVIFDDDDRGVLRAYDSGGHLLQQVFASGDGQGTTKFATLSIGRAAKDIAYVIAGGVSGEGLFLDNLQFQNYAPEPNALALLGLGLAGLAFIRRTKR